MRCPHPWLAAVARANIWLATASLLLTLALFLYQPQCAGWYGSVLLGNFSTCPTAGAVVDMVREYLAAAAAVFVPSVVWLLVARSLRAIATGRATFSVAAGEWPLARLLAPVGLWLATLAVGLAAWRWADPERGVLPVGVRVEQGLSDRTVIEIHYSTPSQWFARASVYRLVRESPDEPIDWGRRLAIVAGYEARMLFAAVTLPAILLCSVGVCYIVTRPTLEVEA